MDPDGTDRRALYSGPGHQWYPSLSPDQTKLLFSTTLQGTDRNIQVMDMATGTVTTLFDTPGIHDSAPAWSPDGTLIAFESYRDGDSDLYLMNADGSNVRQITNNTNWDEGPAWSPDGTRLAFTRAYNPTDFNVWTMRVDGTDERQLTTDPRPEESPDWGRNPGPATVGGTVPATLALTLGGPVSFGTFVPGLARDYTAQTTANVTSTAGNAALAVSDPGHLANGAFTLPQPLHVAMHPAAWAAPVANAPVAITFTQAIGATDALRTGTYTRTLTFTLSTTQP
jgi:dipeptidyl aminopeptidase/acylaminoacyl peptidase